MDPRHADEFSGRWERFRKRTFWVYLGIMREDGSVPGPPSTRGEWVWTIVSTAIAVACGALFVRYLF